MGNFNIKIKAVGAHGCKREAKDGEAVYGCGNMQCPDCITREFVKNLTAKGSIVEEATFTHWPGEETEVVDNLIEPYERKGSFS